ncbi:MAG TPA: hypothetical protein PLV45_01720, partial [bacterium]|nr:hypothetical protein [bacterium]
MSIQIMPEPGDVIEFIEHNRVFCAVCSGIRKSRIQLLTETGRTIHLNPERVLHISPGAIDITASRAVIIELLQAISPRRGDIASRLDLAAAWAATSTRGTHISLRDAVALFSHAQPDSPGNAAPDPADTGAAFIRAVFRTRSYFKIAGRGIYVLTEAEVEDARLKTEEKAREKALIETLSQWLGSTFQTGNAPELPPGYDRLITALEADAAGLPDQPDTKWLQRILSQVSLPSKMNSFQILVHLGIFSPDENLHLIRSGYPRSF